MSNNLPTPPLDQIDRQILNVLRRNGRATNKDVAAEVGIAQSTCLLRIRRLIDTKVIRGFHADVDTGKLGLPLQAMVSVQLRNHSRTENDRFLRKAVQLPGVLSVSLMAGDDDYVLHVVARDAESLSNFVLDALTSDPGIAGSHTKLVFRHLQGAGDWTRA
ncbi:MAG: Lrp/AsnC family transcriptional regulator [Bifidobacteriaceae bacterium]|jgi:DNA-binding Lrp family transcriptional regulator|nr:Lrp/AsnC family transcriptional regulator [Bifidobacteriaceae bacterium]